jgi:hypothetical protein
MKLLNYISLYFYLTLVLESRKWCVQCSKNLLIQNIYMYNLMKIELCISNSLANLNIKFI